jgi:hypothetical protein
MKSKNIKINSKGNEKYLTLIGEIHQYTCEESEWTRNLLKKESIDIVFFEGTPEEDYKYLGKIGNLSRLFYRVIIKPYILISRRNYPSLIDHAESMKIPVKYLERGTSLPIKTQMGLLLLFGILPLTLIVGLLLNKLTFSVLGYGLILGFILASIILGIPSIGEKIGKFFPSLFINREVVMGENLVSYIREVDFRGAVVVVGLLHFNSIASLLEKEFGSNMEVVA